MADQMLIPLRNRAAGRTEGIKRESRRSMFSLFVEFKVKVRDIVLEPEGGETLTVNSCRIEGV